MLNIYHSNRLEVLFQLLRALMDTPLDDVFAAEQVMVANQGMARWLSLELAKAEGISCNTDFPLPANTVWALFKQLLPEDVKKSELDKRTLLWLLLAHLDKLADSDQEGVLAHYLQDEGDEPLPVKQFQLAQKVADVFDQYMVYRPDLLARWEAGEESHWQATLWRLITSVLNEPHRAALQQSFLSLCETGNLAEKLVLPERLFIFNVVAIPPSYLDTIVALSQHVDVHLFFLNPSVQYWDDITSQRELARLRKRWLKDGQQAHSEFYDEGNPLLASMGGLGRNFLRLIHRYETRNEEEYFVDAPVSHLLSHLQRDITLLLTPSGREDELALEPMMIDDSLQMHVAHSAMREVQILHDQLLAQFEKSSDLSPSDILVMVPDIDRYAPYIDAVFGSASEANRIPWVIADRSLAQTQPVISTIMTLLQLPDKRFTASEVMGWLAQPGIRRQLRLDEQQLSRITTWVSESGVRWGLDQGTRQSVCEQPIDLNTWQFGLERLLLGYAMPADEQVFDGVLSYPDVEGKEAAVLGVLYQFITSLTVWQKRLQHARSLDNWLVLLNELVEAFFSLEADEEAAVQLLRDCLQAHIEASQRIQFTDSVDVAVLLELLREAETSGTEQRFITGQVTLCSMVPMRSVPHRVVCLLGMNDRDFPRRQQAPGFDLIAAAPQLGDRSRREDDRYLFLEALLSAGDLFYLSWVGADIRDNSERMPSVLVSELRDYIQQHYADPDALTCYHPLQPFSEHYYNAESSLFSYAHEWLPTMDTQQNTAVMTVAEKLPDAISQASTDIELDDLLRYWHNPSAHYCRRQLNLDLNIDAQPLLDSEPFAMDSLQHYQIADEWLTWRLRGDDDEANLLRLRQRGVLPHGALGALAIAQQRQRFASLLERLASHDRDYLPLQSVSVSSEGQGNIVGSLSTCIALESSVGMLQWRPSKFNAHDGIRLWLQHLVGSAGGVVTAHSQHSALDGDRYFAPLSAQQATEYLAPWVAFYTATEAVPFFPKTAWDLVTGRENDAWGKWLGNNHSPVPGESHALSVQTLFKGYNPFDDQAFLDRSQCLLQPLLAALEETV